MEFGDLAKDGAIQEKLTNFHSTVKKIEKILESALTAEQYQGLPPKEKTDYDLFMAFTLNTLYWLYLRTRGEDPNKNDVRKQLQRVKEHMFKAKNAHERNTIRPKVDQGAAARFVKHGISYKEKEKEPPNKKMRFD